MSYQDDIQQVETLIRSKQGTWSGISAESVIRMRVQNRFRSGLDIARYTAAIMRRDMAAYDADPANYTQSLGCWHGFIGQQKMIAIKKHFGTTDRKYLYLSGWMVAALRSDFGPLPDQSMHEKTSVPALIEELYTFLKQADARELGMMFRDLDAARAAGDKGKEAAILKGIDDAIRAGSTDATNSLREELVKLRDGAAKGKADLEALTVRQQNTEKLARAAEAQAKKAADELKSLAEKASSDIAAAKTGSEKLSAQVAELRTKNEESLARASEAEKSLAKTMSELTTTKNQLGGQIAKLKTENESLNRDLASVKELSLAIKNQGGPRDPLVKVDPATVADKYFSGGARAFHAGNYSEAEASLVKGIAIFGDDARYHYLLGLALHSQGKMKEAETAFARGAELESQGRPGGKSIDAILERVQGSVRPRHY